jgi:hypothetical protein
MYKTSLSDEKGYTSPEIIKSETGHENSAWVRSVTIRPAGDLALFNILAELDDGSGNPVGYRT